MWYSWGVRSSQAIGNNQLPQETFNNFGADNNNDNNNTVSEVVVHNDMY